MFLRSFFVMIFATVFSMGAARANDPFEVTMQQVEDRKAVLATVQTIDLTPARARIGGTIVDLLVDEGSAVKAGEVIARIKDEKLDLEMQAVDARTASLQAERKLAEIVLPHINEEYKFKFLFLVKFPFFVIGAV